MPITNPISEANVSAQEDGAEVWKGGGGAEGLRRGSRPITTESQFPMQNGRVKFDPPTVPVIFVLGGFNTLIIICHNINNTHISDAFVDNRHHVHDNIVYDCGNI